MTAIDRFDPFEQRIAAAIDEIAAPRRPDYLDDLLRQTARTAQRPAWTFPGRWLPMDVPLMRPGPVALAPAWAVLVLVGLLTALLGAVLLAGGRPGIPAAVPPHLVLVSGSEVTCLDVDALGIEGGSLRRIVDCADRIAITADGTRAAIGGDHGLTIVDLRDGSRTTFIDTGADRVFPIAWSPDGRWLHWVGCGADSLGPCEGVIGAPYSNLRIEVPEPADGGYWGGITWSADGSRVLVPTDGAHLVGNGDGSGLEPLGLDGAPLAWSADGTRFVSRKSLVRAGSTVAVDAWESAGDGAGGRNLTNFTPGGFAQFAAWSPDGRTLAIVRGIRGQDGTLRGDVEMTHDLWLVDPDGSLRRVALPADLTGLDARDSQTVIRWSPDGSRLAIEGVGAGGSSAATYIVPVGGAPVVVVPDAVRPAWSPDGRSIAMIGRAGTTATIDIANADGSDRHAVGNAPAGEWGQVLWAP